MLTYYPAIGGWFVAFRRKYLMGFSDTLDGRGGDSAKAAETFLPLIPTTPRKAKLTGICGNFFIFFSFPTPPKITNCQTNRTGFLFAALHGQLADLPNGRGNFFLSPMHGIIPTIFENAKNGRKKTGNLFLISCLSVSSYPAAIFSFWLMDMFIVKI